MKTRIERRAGVVTKVEHQLQYLFVMMFENKQRIETLVIRLDSLTIEEQAKVKTGNLFYWDISIDNNGTYRTFTLESLPSTRLNDIRKGISDTKAAAIKLLKEHND